jgi:hypothetical protein
MTILARVTLVMSKMIQLVALSRKISSSTMLLPLKSPLLLQTCQLPQALLVAPQALHPPP